MRYLTIIFCAVLVLFSFGETQATIVHVPSDSSTIQGGINGAVNGDTVLVAPGTYYEHINFNGKAILVRSESGAQNTVITKLASGLPIVTFSSGEDTTSILEGFCIREADDEDAAVLCYHSSPKIVNNRLTSNNVYATISCKGTHAVIAHNEITSTSIMGIWSSDYDSARIAYNVIANNHSLGIDAYHNSFAVLLNNTFDGNGNNIYCEGSSPIIKNNIITNSTGYGIDCTGASPAISDNDVWNNAARNYDECLPGVGDISADPLFCDLQGGNYYLNASSPCHGTGQSGADMGALGVGCGVVAVTPGPDQVGPANTQVSVSFSIQNVGNSADTFDLNISDSLSWSIVPTYYQVACDSGQVDTVTFTVSIPWVPIGTVDRLRLTAVSQTYPSNSDTAYLTVTCNAHIEGVGVTAGSNESGYADSLASVAFLVQNIGVVPDSYSLDISDTQGWNIVPLHYDLVLDTAETEPVSFTVFIPYVLLGTVDQLTLLAVSKTNPLARDSASLSVTCNAYVENWSISPGANLSAPAHSQVTAQFYVQNAGLARDSCYLHVADSLGWLIDPQNYQLSLNPGQRDSVFFNVQIPSVPVGTTNKIILAGRSLTNPYVADTTFLLALCSSYNITITDISDIGNDQGKQVKIRWSSFPGSDPLVTHFTIFRREDSLLFVSLNAKPELFSSKDYPPGSWEMVAAYPAYGETLYSTIVPTLRDSTIAEGVYWSVFFIRAGTTNPILYFDSPIDSGYSLDNLSPSPPADLFASHEPAATKLRWTGTTALDFDYYTIYRDTLSGFTPASGNKLGFAIETAFADSTAQLGRTYYYLVSATDFSGNESDPSNEAMGLRYITGDANTDGQINSADVVYLINYLFIGGPPPTPLVAGDVNCDGKINAVDVVYLINYLFIGGPPPCEP